MSKTQLPKWTTDREEQLKKLVGREKPVSANTVRKIAEKMETSVASISTKLRLLKYEVESTAQSKNKVFNDVQASELETFLETNSGKYTYEEIANNIFDGKFNKKQIQGKILSMDLTSFVKETEKVEVVKVYSDVEEAKILTLVKEGKFMEDIAEAMNKPLNSIRGKILSMSTKDDSIKIPKLRTYKETAVNTDPISTLEGIGDLTVAEIAEKVGKSERGVKVMLTHRGIDCANYKGAKKAEKIEAKKQAA